MKQRVGVVADDITGANDIGIMFSKSGYRSAVFPLELISDCDMQKEAEELDVIIIDTDSRFDPQEEARNKVRQATQILMELSCDRYHNKTCSVFRGNIGAEFDEMQDVLGVSCSMVIAGFPDNGRTTVDGIHYVYGTKLEESQFKKDPIHPMDTSSLKEIMEKQTTRKIANITVSDLDRGASFVREKKEALKKEYHYVIFDVRNQEDLRLIAEAVADEISLCGSSAIGQELPAVYEQLRPDPGCLIVAGSLTAQSIAQVEYLKEAGCISFPFSAECIYEEEEIEKEINRLIQEASRVLLQTGRVLVHTPNRPECVEAVKEEGRRRGLKHEEIGKLISGAMCQITRGVLEETGCRKLVVAGGDTSAAVTRQLRICSMRIGQEIEAGVPLMEGKSSLGRLSLVLKSGSFGSDAFLEKASGCV